MADVLHKRNFFYCTSSISTLRKCHSQLSNLTFSSALIHKTASSGITSHETAANCFRSVRKQSYKKKYLPSCFRMPLPILLLQRLLMSVGSALLHSLHPAQFLLTPPTPTPLETSPGEGVLWYPACGWPCELPWGDGNPVTETLTLLFSLKSRLRSRSCILRAWGEFL